MISPRIGHRQTPRFRNLIVLTASAAASFIAAEAKAAVTYEFTALSGGYNQTGSFTVTLPDFYPDVPGGFLGGGTPLPVTSCEARTLGNAGVPAQALQCGNQYFSNDNTSGTAATNNPGIYDVVTFSTSFPGNNPQCCTGFFYYFDKSAFQNAGFYESLVLGPTQAGTLRVTVTAVPEPAVWAMMILGMGATGFAMRRRNKNDSTTVRFA